MDPTLLVLLLAEDTLHTVDLFGPLMRRLLEDFVLGHSVGLDFLRKLLLVLL